MRKSFWVIIAAQLLMCAVVVLNIHIAREIFVCIYLSIVPGFLILKLLRLEETNFVNTILFSVGLSIALLMSVGLLMNELFPLLLGISRPLSTIPLMITISVLTFALFLAGYKQDFAMNKNTRLINTEFKAFPSQALFFVCIPLLSVIGALYANIPLLLLMILAIAVLYALSVSSNRVIPTKLFPLSIIAISVALLFHTVLISKYFIGYDVHTEYYVFKLIEINGYWDPTAILTYPAANYNAMLSVTILPTIYSLLSNVNGELIFKILYPLVFSLIPLALYQVYEVQTGKLVALISVFFFISSPNIFYGPTPISLSRQIIGELFFTLLILLSVNEKINPKKRQILFMIFCSALVVSHYFLSYLYLFYIVLTFIFSTKKYTNKMINKESVLYFIAVIFSWYIYISYSPTKNLIHNVQWMYYNFFVDIINPKARELWVFSPLTPTIVSMLDKILFYLRHSFIVIGIMRLIFKPKKMNFYSDYRIMSILSMFIMFSCFAIPYFAILVGIERFYHMALLFLAPFFVFGGETVLSWICKLRNVIKPMMYPYKNLHFRLLSIFLIVSFLFQVGFVSKVTGDFPTSYSIDMIRLKTAKNLETKISFYDSFTPGQDVFGAKWLSKYTNETSLVYADQDSRDHFLTSYGLIPQDRMYPLSNTTTLGQNSFIYLRHINVIDGIIIKYENEFNISEISSLLRQSNKIYSNRDSEIYCSPGD